MDSFTVQCTSCQSRIRVRNPNMIGQIANCPKCSSMILIAAPQKITVESGNPTDSLAVTREALPPPDPASLQASPDHQSTFKGSRPASPSSAASQPPSPPSPPPPPDPGSVTDFTSFDELSGEPGAVASAPIDPLANDFAVDDSMFENLSPSAWMPEAVEASKTDEVNTSIDNVRKKRLEAESKSKQVMMIVGIGSLSVLFALGLLFAFLSWFAKPDSKVVADKKPAVVDPGKPDVTQTSEQASPAPAEPAQPAADDQSTIPAQPGEAPVAAPLEPVTPTTPSEPSPATEAGTEGTVPDAPVQPKPPRAPGIGGSIAPNLDEVLGAPATPAEPGTKATAELPPGLQNFANLFGFSLEPVLPDAAVPLAKAPEVPDNAPKVDKVDGDPGDGLPSIVEQRLETQLGGMLIDKRPLSETLCMLGLLADMPVMVDMDSILAGGLPRNPQIEFRSATPAKLMDVFKRMETDTGISFVPWENKVLYARSSDELLEKHIPESLPIDDLVNDAQSSEALLLAIKEVLPEVSEAVVSDGQIQLKLNSDNRVLWFQVARLLETWRTARGIKNDKTASLVPAKNVLPAWPVAAFEPYAQTKIKQTLNSKEPIVRTWQRFTLEAKVACWVDWYSLAAAKIAPSELAIVINQDRTLEDLLQHYANVYKVVFAIEDARNLWVTTVDGHRVQPRLYLLPLADKTAEAWAEQLQDLAPLNPATGESMLKLVPTPDGQYLFARACRPILCQPNRN